MTANEKRKYLSGKQLELLAPYGYFSRYNSVWKYSLQGKYIICISFDIARFGFLNEIEVCFGSFYAPIQKSSDSAKALFLGNLLRLDFYLRNTGLGTALLRNILVFEEQVDAIMPFFKSIVFPLLPKDDDPNAYLTKSEQLIQMHSASMHGIPVGVDVKETAFGYLSLNRPEEAVRVVSQYAEQCRAAAKYIGDHVEIFQYDIEEQVHHWERKHEEALALKEALRADNGKAFEPEIKRMEQESEAVCRQFFHISK